ncbi:MAG TPA: DUF4430 domain-containing protein [Solirubrobacteraceae bacterium]|nr:DUF4430 domain-containing protein [Solirubrobacteraceae bacterium]
MLTALAAAGLLAGCGLGPGAAPSGVQLTVSSDFGTAVLRQSSAPHVRGSETAMSLLMRNDNVSTRFGGGFVQSIAGRSGGQSHGQPIDWFYYVNGIEAPKGAADTVVHAGDRIWWDLHDWSQTENVPAVVGSFPEPFVHGVNGKRLPVRVECAEVQSASCHSVSARLRALGVPAAISTVVPGDAPDTLRLLVGPWHSVASDPAVQNIARGPGASGVYVRVSAHGALSVLDAAGRNVRTLTAGAGLIAATRYSEGGPVWVITGTDPFGVSAAVGAFNQSTLHNRFAVALAGPGATLAVPQPSP